MPRRHLAPQPAGVLIDDEFAHTRHVAGDHGQARGQGLHDGHGYALGHARRGRHRRMHEDRSFTVEHPDIVAGPGAGELDHVLQTESPDLLLEIVVELTTPDDEASERRALAAEPGTSIDEVSVPLVGRGLPRPTASVRRPSCGETVRPPPSIVGSRSRSGSRGHALQPGPGLDEQATVVVRDGDDGGRGISFSDSIDVSTYRSWACTVTL